MLVCILLTRASKLPNSCGTSDDGPEELWGVQERETLVRTLLKSLAFGLMLLSISVPIAAADQEWCTDDPPRALTTPHGNIVLVYETLGSQGDQYLLDLTLALAGTTYTATNTVQAGTLGTSFTLSVPVHNDPIFGSFAAEGFTSSLPLANGTIYASFTGTSGHTSTMTFWYPLQ